ncbi:hypothetical protein [Billgrantia desiderata]
MQKLQTQARVLRALSPIAMIDPSVAIFLVGISVILLIKAELEL